MVVRRHASVVNSLRPGTRDIPNDAPPLHGAVETQRRIAERRRNQQARAANRAYGTLNLTMFDERMITAPQAIEPPQGRPKRKR